jgi:deoxyribodipyrimidine photo-lyase
MAPAEEVGLVWFRRDLRLEDNPAWAAATSQRKFVVPLYVIDPTLLASVGPYRRRQLIANLQALDYDLFEETGGRLHVRFGDPRTVVPEGVARLGATALFVNADESSFARRRDDAVAAALDVPVEAWHGSLVLPPGSVLTTKGALSKVFSAFHKAWAKAEWDPWPEPSGDPVVYEDPGEPLPFLDDQPPYFEGAKEARRRLDAVLEQLDAATAGDAADVAAEAMTHLAADLRYGTISARGVVRSVGDSSPARQELVRRLARRDWYAHQLQQQPTLPNEEQVLKHRSIPWRNTPAQISAWKGGFTGYPFVDAAMRELRERGRMGHAARVGAASFLVKDLLVDWRIGQKHVRHLLVDADPAQDAGFWQWAAGTGNDAAPINRVIDPVEHSRRHDPSGAYIRRWVPELATLDDDALHAPWSASAEALADAGVVLGHDYPEPIVDHEVARDEFLSAIRSGATTRSRRAEPKAVELVPDAMGRDDDAGAGSGERPSVDASLTVSTDEVGSDDHVRADGDHGRLEPPAAAS